VEDLEEEGFVFGGEGDFVFGGEGEGEVGGALGEEIVLLSFDVGAVFDVEVEGGVFGDEGAEAGLGDVGTVFEGDVAKLRGGLGEAGEVGIGEGGLNEGVVFEEGEGEELLDEAVLVLGGEGFPGDVGDEGLEGFFGRGDPVFCFSSDAGFVFAEGGFDGEAGVDGALEVDGFFDPGGVFAVDVEEGAVKGLFVLGDGFLVVLEDFLVVAGEDGMGFFEEVPVGGLGVCFKVGLEGLEFGVEGMDETRLVGEWGGEGDGELEFFVFLFGEDFLGAEGFVVGVLFDDGVEPFDDDFFGAEFEEGVSEGGVDFLVHLGEAEGNVFDVNHVFVSGVFLGEDVFALDDGVGEGHVAIEADDVEVLGIVAGGGEHKIVGFAVDGVDEDAEDDGG